MRTVTGLLVCLAACASAPQPQRSVIALAPDDRVAVVYRQSNGFTQVLRSPTTEARPPGTPAPADYYERVLSIDELQQVLDALAAGRFFDHARAQDAPRGRASLAVHVNGSSHVWPAVAQSQEAMAQFHDCLQLMQAVFNGTAGFQRADAREKEAFLRQEEVKDARNQGLQRESRLPVRKQ